MKNLSELTDFYYKTLYPTLEKLDSAQNTFGDLIGTWLQSNNASRDELVKMDSPKFEKEFVVYSTDQIEARYILSHALMEKLLNFKKKSSHPVSIIDELKLNEKLWSKE